MRIPRLPVIVMSVTDSPAQVDSSGRLRHLLTLDGLPRPVLEALLDHAQAWLDDDAPSRGLAGTAICTLFFEPSTRTRLSFQRAAQRLGADVLGFDASTSSTTKGETALDTFRNIEAMGVRGFVVRHSADGAVEPKLEDKVSFAGAQWSIVNIERKLVNDQTVAWFIQVRK